MRLVGGFPSLCDLWQQYSRERLLRFLGRAGRHRESGSERNASIGQLVAESEKLHSLMTALVTPNCRAATPSSSEGCSHAKHRFYRPHFTRAAMLFTFAARASKYNSVAWVGAPAAVNNPWRTAGGGGTPLSTGGIASGGSTVTATGGALAHDGSVERASLGTAGVASAGSTGNSDRWNSSGGH